MTFTGKQIMAALNEMLAEKLEDFNFTPKELQLFLLGMEIGAEGMERLWLDKQVKGSPTSYSVQSDIIDLFLGHKTRDAEYNENKLKEILETR
jgi:hypothetical protein